MKRNLNKISAEDQPQMTSALQCYDLALVPYVENISENDKERYSYV